MDEQTENIERVAAKIGPTVMEFYYARGPGALFHAADLHAWVRRRAGVAPASADRILRLLRQAGMLDYEVVDRANSLYRFGGTMSIAAQEEGAHGAEWTDQDLIEKYHQIKAYIEKREASLAEVLKEPREGLEAIKNALLARLNARQADNTKTEAGTAYKSKILDVKVIDRQAFLQFCIAHWDDNGSDLLQVGAVKDPVKKMMQEGEVPPGIETSTTIRINIRKPT